MSVFTDVRKAMELIKSAVPAAPLCAVVGCSNRWAVYIRVNRSTVLPLCDACESKRLRSVCKDGDALLTVDRGRLVFLPE